MRFPRHRALAAVLASLSLVPAARVLAQGGGDATLERCEKPLGTLAVVEPQDAVIAALRSYRLESPTSLIRMMVQQSGCFLVVERGEGMRSLMQERALGESGELQGNSNVGKGQLRAADFVLTPAIIFSEGNAGGVGGAVAGLVGGRLGGIGGLAGGVKFKEAQTSLLVSDVRSGLQVAAAEGRARKADFSLGMLGWGGGVLGAVGGYTNTNEGKVIAASFLANYNKVVIAIRSDPTLASLASAPAPGRAVKAGAVYAEGDVLAPKIGNVRLLAAPAEGARALGTLGTTDGLVFLGEERNGYLRVQGTAAEGWVRTALVARR